MDQNTLTSNATCETIQVTEVSSKTLDLFSNYFNSLSTTRPAQNAILAVHIPQSTEDLLSSGPVQPRALIQKKGDVSQSQRVVPMNQSPQEQPKIIAAQRFTIQARIPLPATKSKLVDFGTHLSIVKPHSGTLTINRSVFNGENFTDFTTPDFLFQRLLLDEKRNFRRFRLFNGDDSVDPVLAHGTGVIRSRFALNKAQVVLPARSDSAFEFSAIYLDDELYYRTFSFKRLSEDRPTIFRWKNSAGKEVKGLGKRFMAQGMKLINVDTREVVMAYVKPAHWEKKMTREGEKKGRVGFVGERYGTDFETMALFTLLIMIDSQWEC